MALWRPGGSPCEAPVASPANGVEPAGWPRRQSLKMPLRAGEAHGAGHPAFARSVQIDAWVLCVESRFKPVAIECAWLKEMPLSHAIPTMRMPIDATDSIHESQAIKTASNAFAI